MALGLVGGGNVIVFVVVVAVAKVGCGFGE